MNQWCVIPFACLLAVGACEINDGDDDDDQRADATTPGRDAAIRDASQPSSDGSVTLPDASRADAGRSDAGPGGDEDAGPGAAIDCDADNGGIQLPNGFCAVVFADNLGKARHLSVSPAGDVYVAVADPMGEGAGGDVAALRDTDGDLRADVIEHFGDTGGNGILWFEGKLYFAPNDRVLRYDLPSGTLVPDDEPVTLVQGLPDTPDHNAKTIAINGSDLFVNIGSASNACQVMNRVLESPGVDPCPELDTRAGVWRFDATLVGQRQADGARFAMGTRNLNALAFEPGSGELYGALNGRDQLFENWPSLYTMQDDLRLPSEELLHLRAGDDYGWPYCYYDETLGRRVLAPEYGGDGVMAGRCAELDEPIAVYPAHWAPLSMLFYDGVQFPARYRGGIFIAFHGSRFEPQAMGDLPGYNVVFQPFDNGAPSGAFEEFATGFAGTGRPLPEAALHRPVGLAVGPDGSLYVGDDVGGRIWRVFYTGP